MTEEQKEYLMDIQTDLLTEIGFCIHIEYINKQNEELHRRGKDHRASYTTLSDFIKYLPINRNYRKCMEEAKFVIRKDKIEKIINEI